MYELIETNKYLGGRVDCIYLSDDPYTFMIRSLVGKDGILIGKARRDADLIQKWVRFPIHTDIMNYKPHLNFFNAMYREINLEHGNMKITVTGEEDEFPAIVLREIQKSPIQRAASLDENMVKIGLYYSKAFTTRNFLVLEYCDSFVASNIL